jgi:protein-L-isoaspartate(D-aspartate) O-methyltransferase
MMPAQRSAQRCASLEERNGSPMTAEQPAGAASLHAALVDNLVERELIRSPRVEAAFRAVRRELFLPDVPVEQVYRDESVITRVDEAGRPVSSSSQPAIMAIMLEQLDVQPGQHVLEIGAGTGYNAALLAHITGEQGRVTTIDIDAELVEEARRNLAAAGLETVEVIAGDGMRGYAPNAPYDRIVLTVAGWDIPPEWLAQLKPNGRLLLPLSFYGPQLSIAFEREDGHLASRSVKACGFVPLRGPRAEPVLRVPVGERRELILARPEEEARRTDGAARQTDGAGRQTDAAVLAAWLRGPFDEQATGVVLPGGELLFKWALWAGLHEPGHVLLSGSGEVEAGEPLLALLPHTSVTMGILSDSGLALLAEVGDRQPAADCDPLGESIPLAVRSYGADSAVAARLVDQLQAWDAAGRPPAAGAMAVWALPATEAAEALPADVTLTRRWQRFGIRWDTAG